MVLGRLVVPVSHSEDVDRDHVVVQSEVPADDVGLEHADPQCAESHVGSLVHHLRRNDRGVDVGGLHAVVAAGPGLAPVGADDERQRGVVDVPRLLQLREALLGPDGDDADRLVVPGCGREASGLQDGADHVVLDGIGLVGTARVSSPDKFVEIHRNHRGFVSSISYLGVSRGRRHGRTSARRFPRPLDGSRSRMSR